MIYLIKKKLFLIKFDFFLKKKFLSNALLPNTEFDTNIQLNNIFILKIYFYSSILYETSLNLKFFMNPS